MDWCCQVWLDLGKEMAEAKLVSLDKLIKKGIPRSTFAPIYRILEGIDHACPLCGCRLAVGGAVPKPTPAAPIAPKTVSKVPATIPCPPCKGTGKVGDGISCSTCFGEGKLDKSNPFRKSFDKAFREELAGREVAINENIVKKNAEIEANPQPLRDDAKPEAWQKL